MCHCSAFWRGLSLGVEGLLWRLAHPPGLVTVIIGYTWLAFLLRVPASGGFVADTGMDCRGVALEDVAKSRYDLLLRVRTARYI